VVSTLAGDGIFSYADGSGSNARFNAPQSVTFDSSGNIIVADTNNQRLRRVTPFGGTTDARLLPRAIEGRIGIDGVLGVSRDDVLNTMTLLAFATICC
jgi:hypothetical protein